MKQGWVLKKLGEICDFQNGFVFKSKTYKETGLPILRITNIQNQSLEVNELVYFDEKDYQEKFDRYKVFKGDLVIAMSGATTGKLGINTTDTVFYLNQRVGKFIPKKILLKPFLYYFLSTKVEESLRIAAGAAQPNLSTEQINNFEIPLPPLPEQQRIVSILDEAFAAIAKAKANTEQNLKNAKELFESYLQSVFENKGEGWEEKTLGEVCSLITDGKHGDCENEENSGYYFLSAKDVRRNTLLFENARQITKSGFEETHRRTNLKPGDICMVNTGATIGRISFAPDDPKTFKTTFQKSVAIIKTIPTLINNHYCCYLLKSDLKKLVRVSSGTAVPNLLLGDLKRHRISLPKSLPEQQAIVAKLDALSAETKKLVATYERKIEDLEELKKSILQKAFKGELKTSQPVPV